MKTYLAVLTTLLLVSVPHGARAQGTVVVNGGFDTSAAGWTLSDGSFFGASFGNPPGSVRLDNANPSPSITPSASQTVTGLVSGATYAVSGDYLLQGKNPPPGNSFGVAVDGVFLFQTAAPIDINWYSFNFLYSATDSSAVLSLASMLNGTGIPYIIDNIAMYRIPEPSSSLLMGLGVLASAVFLKHRRRQLL